MLRYVSCSSLIFYMYAAYSEVGGDEELPLGEEFQAHINSFINPVSRDPLEKYKMAEKLIKALA